MARVKNSVPCPNHPDKLPYARGLCHACYMKALRKGEWPGEPPEDNEDMPVDPMRQNDVDEMLAHQGAAGPLALSPDNIYEDRATDTDSIRKARAYLRGATWEERRELVRHMLLNGLDKRKIMLEFFRDPRLFKRFIALSKDVSRMLDEDIKAVGDITPQMVYLENLEITIRQAKTLILDGSLSAKERSSWVKELRELNRELGIVRRVIHVRTGRGVVPVSPIHADGAEGDDYDDEEDEEEFKLPDVRGDANRRERDERDARVQERQSAADDGGQPDTAGNND